MQENNPFSNIVSQIQSRDDQNLLLDELSALKNSLFQIKQNTFDQVLTTKVRQKISAELEKILTASSDRAGLLDQLTKQVQDLKTLDLTLSFEPTVETRQKIFTWVKTNMGEGVVINLKFDPTIIGGAQIAFNGKYVDLSLKKIIDTIKR
ncbi:MAG: F0F1 ATP synthase subunit delta [Patescibacteria group bacterium]